MPNSSSNAMTSSTVSSESAPRSSTNDASGVTSSSSTPSCSTMMPFTLSATAIQPPLKKEEGRRIRMTLLPSHVHPAVDGEHLPGNIRCLIRGKKTDRRGDVVRPPEPTQWNPRLPLLAGPLGNLPCHVGFDQPRRDDVGGD